MQLKVGMHVVVRPSWGRDAPVKGIVDSISIALRPSDVAGESGAKVQEYDTSLKYKGSFGYTTENNDSQWAYFYQLDEPKPKDESDLEAEEHEAWVDEQINNYVDPAVIAQLEGA